MKIGMKKARIVLKIDAQSTEPHKLTPVAPLIEERLYRLAERLDNLSQIKLCLRGDAKASLKAHNVFLRHRIGDLFIVGEKAKSNVEMPGERFKHYEEREAVHPTDLQYIIEEVNSEIETKPESHNIIGSLSTNFTSFVMKLSESDKKKWKVFFLSFLHNNGKLRDYKDYSPFISLTSGRNKFAIARKFAIGGRNKFGKGLIYVYALNSGWPYYICASDITKTLKRYGVKWYKDVNSEILLLNGMYPHFMLGVYVVDKKGYESFIVNPWFYDLLSSENYEYDLQNGVHVNQQNFSYFAKRMGYKYFFFHMINDSNEFISEIGHFNPRAVLRP
ncbi:MAG: hypothetical protein WCI01_09140 [Chlorobiaceae bacterium]